MANLTNVNQISAGQYHTCAALKDGTLQCWGHNNVGQVGNETSINATAAEPVANFPCGGGGTSNVCGCTPTTCQAQGAASGSISDGCGGTLLCGVPATTLAGGNNFACAVAGDGSVKCWGYNNKGQLGGNGTSSSPVPFTVPGIANAVQVSAGEGHACAVLKGGSLWCWGSHSLGQLGLGTATDNVVHPPTQVPGITNAIRISAGRQHTCAVLSDGTARCWGYNYYGQVGDGSTQTRTGPVAVLDLTGVIDIVASYNGTCALKQTGLVKCWGDNYYGQLGNGTVTFGTPMNVAKLTGVTSLGTSPQAQHACAILADGTARCWGYNGYGQLADNSTVSRNLPAVANGIAGATSISLGSNHTCATLTNGTGKCWGYNTWGQLGDGTTGNKSLPVAVSGLSGATSAALQYSASCFAVSGGGVKCTGYNLSGGLGDNTTSSKSALVPVQGMP
ncbi:MAG: hypothetical protein HY902_20610 [Deltaproteobacteria bacterium]|nr:hypothetical protein [Deltaproteobacteria bacterium]